MIENHNLLIKSMEMSVEEQYFIMKMETDRNSMKDHDFRCCIYADDYFLMCTDAEENAPNQRIEATDIQRAYEKFNPKTIELKPRRQVGFSA